MLRHGSRIARLLLATSLVSSQAFAGDLVNCQDFEADGSFPNTKVNSAKVIPPSEERKTGAYCEIEATIKPTRGSNINVVYRFPQNWNGKLYALGGGGFAGNLKLDAALPALQRGYAVAQNDLGNPSPDSLNADFAISEPGKPNMDALTDFGYRATNSMTKIAKQIIVEHYGKNPLKSYFEGCSTGGRQGLASMQRYAEDFDGIIAGAPVYNAQVYTNAIFRVQAFHAKPGSNLMPEHAGLIGKSVMDACDAQDGLKDGILTDPRMCTWDPGVLECKAGQSGGQCLTPAQVETVRKVYAGLKGADGKWRAYPLMRGGEADWAVRMIGNADMPKGLNARLGAPFVSHLVKAEKDFDIMAFDVDKGVEEIEKSLAGDRVLATNTNVARYAGRGGKLLMWHGFNDPGPSPLATIEYFEAVQKSMSDPNGEKVRLFMAPGVGHCRGGAGPDRFDMLTALENWVEKNQAPETIIATKAESKVSRPLCPYPKLPKYKGSGDENDPANFVCERLGG
jgi:feruloyl esterase